MDSQISDAIRFGLHTGAVIGAIVGAVAYWIRPEVAVGLILAWSAMLVVAIWRRAGTEGLVDVLGGRR